MDTPSNIRLCLDCLRCQKTSTPTPSLCRRARNSTCAEPLVFGGGGRFMADLRRGLRLRHVRVAHDSCSDLR